MRSLPKPPAPKPAPAPKPKGMELMPARQARCRSTQNLRDFVCIDETLRCERRQRHKGAHRALSTRLISRFRADGRLPISWARPR
jgi:hypothetical protein